MGGRSVDVSFIVPARNEQAFLGATLDSIDAQRTSRQYEVIVVDGDSSDTTPAIARNYGAELISGAGTGRADGRNRGAAQAKGEWLVFIDADTILRPIYLDTILDYMDEHNLSGGGSRCEITGGWRTRPFEVLFNYILPNLSPPVMPGFNIAVQKDAYEEIGGFPSLPNEDVEFSRRLGRKFPTAVCPTVLVTTSGRRIEQNGFVNAVAYYWKTDRKRKRHPNNG